MRKRGRQGGGKKSDERVAGPRMGGPEHKHRGRNDCNQPEQLEQRGTVRRSIVRPAVHQNSSRAKKIAVNTRSAITIATTHSTTV